MTFREFLKEETTAGDIATVDSKLGAKAAPLKGKCKKHKKADCPECKETQEES